MNWRHRGTDFGFGRGLSSRPQTRSSNALCSARTPVNATPLSPSPHKNSAPGVSRPLRLARSSAPFLRCFSACLSDLWASGSVWMSSTPSSARRSPSPLTANVDATCPVGGVDLPTRIGGAKDVPPMGSKPNPHACGPRRGCGAWSLGKRTPGRNYPELSGR